MAAEVVGLPLAGHVFDDGRHGDRALRASWHIDAGLFVLSLWRGATCVGTAQLTPEEAARLSGLIAEGLAELAAGQVPASRSTTGASASTKPSSTTT